MFRLLTLVSLTLVVMADEDTMAVPTYLMNYILDCKQQSVPGGFGVPVYQTNIQGTATSQHVSLLDLDELGESLKKSVHNDAIVSHILGQVNEAVSDKTRGRSECTVENNIQIEVPPQEIEDFNDRVQILIRQNSFLLLEQINTLFAFKLRSLKNDIDKAIRRRVKGVEEKLDLLLDHFGIEVPEEVVEEDVDGGDDVDDVTDEPDLVDSVFPSLVDDSGETEINLVTTMEPTPEPEPVTESSPEPEPETVPESTAEAESVDEASPEPVAVVEPAQVPEPTPGPFPIIINIDDDDDDDDDVISASTPGASSISGDSSSTQDETSDETGDVMGSSPTSSGGFIRTPQQEVAAVAPSQQSLSDPIVTHSGLTFMRPITRRKYQRPSTFWRDRLEARRRIPTK